jgi:bifunctional non-homologous end joining protein LigD
MLAQLADELPVGPVWTYEVKWDGYRAIAVKDGKRVELLSRNQKDLTRDYPGIAAAIATLRSPSVVLDGEIVALDAEGRPSFQALQHRSTSGLALVYVAFDVLAVSGASLLRRPLKERRAELRSLLAPPPAGVLVSEPLPGSPTRIEAEIRRLGLEGVVAKRGDSPYLPGQRSDAWVKVKFSPQQEFVVGGYKPNASNFESLLVGYYGTDKKLRYAAKLRAGFTPHTKAEIFRRIADRPAGRCAFADLPNSAGSSRWGEGITEEDMAKLKWVKPELVVAVGFVEWTRDGLLRHPKFVGVRNDKKPRDVVRERAGDR